MALNLRQKITLSHVGLIGLTLVVLTLVLDILVINHFREFYEGVREGMFLGPPPRENFEGAVRVSALITVLVAGVIGTVISFLLAKYITDPIQTVIETTQAIAKGDTKQRIAWPTEEDEIGDLVNAVNEMATALEAHEQLQKDLIANVSHELATPLTNITGYIEALKDNVIRDPEKRHRALTVIQEETARLKTMLEEIRTLAFIERPGFQIHPKKVDVVTLAQKTLRSMSPLFRKKQIKLSLDSTLNSNTAWLDPARFTQILSNLLSNAEKFTPSKGAVTVELHETEEKIRLTVKDTGVGISQKELPRLFERFYRTDKARARHTGGTGLGLTITKELVEAHGGTITVHSTPNQGTTVTCEFPRKTTSSKIKATT